MPVYVAVKTLAAINEAIEKDQGASFRVNLGQVITSAGDAYAPGGDDFRSHLGASIIGKDCARDIFYGFHWVRKPKFEGRILRLFNRGHLEEPRFVAMLRMIGCTVYQVDGDGNQFRISDHGGHFGSAIDGVVIGCPDMPDPNTPIIAEFKTHGDKSFKKLASEGVRLAKFQHYVQMQIYMGSYKLTAALYMAVNKNDDDLYAELIEFDQATYDRFTHRAKTIILAQEPPARLNDSPGYYMCKFCDNYGPCHKKQPVERNCRTCQFAKVDIETGKWWCHNEKRRMELLFSASNPLNEDFSLSKARQLTGCEHHEVNEIFK